MGEEGVVMEELGTGKVPASAESPTAAKKGKFATPVLQLEPSVLSLPEPLDRVSNATLSLFNPTDTHVAFKMKTTNPKRYCMRPTSGVVGPHESVQVAILREVVTDPNVALDLASGRCKDKFLVQSLLLTPEELAASEPQSPEGERDLAEVWKTREKSSFMEQRLKVDHGIAPKENVIGAAGAAGTTGEQPSAQPVQTEYLFKTLVIGDEMTGKTSIIKRYVHDTFSTSYRATIGVDFALKVISVEDAIVRLQLWDVAGQERLGNMAGVYYKDAVGAFLVVHPNVDDVSLKRSLKWKKDIDAKVKLSDGSTIPCMLLVNKTDLAEPGTELDVAALNRFVEENGFIGWKATSALDNIGIDEAMTQLTKEIMARAGKVSQIEGPDEDKPAAPAPGGGEGGGITPRQFAVPTPLEKGVRSSRVAASAERSSASSSGLHRRRLPFDSMDSFDSTSGGQSNRRRGSDLQASGQPRGWDGDSKDEDERPRARPHPQLQRRCSDPIAFVADDLHTRGGGPLEFLVGNRRDESDERPRARLLLQRRCSDPIAFVADDIHSRGPGGGGGLDMFGGPRARSIYAGEGDARLPFYFAAKSEEPSVARRDMVRAALLFPLRALVMFFLLTVYYPIVLVLREIGLLMLICGCVGGESLAGRWILREGATVEQIRSEAGWVVAIVLLVVPSLLFVPVAVVAGPFSLAVKGGTVALGMSLTEHLLPLFLMAGIAVLAALVQSLSAVRGDPVKYFVLPEVKLHSAVILDRTKLAGSLKAGANVAEFLGCLLWGAALAATPFVVRWLVGRPLVPASLADAVLSVVAAASYVGAAYVASVISSMSTRDPTLLCALAKKMRPLRGLEWHYSFPGVSHGEFSTGVKGTLCEEEGLVRWLAAREDIRLVLRHTTFMYAIPLLVVTYAILALVAYVRLFRLERFDEATASTVIIFVGITLVLLRFLGVALKLTKACGVHVKEDLAALAEALAVRLVDKAVYDAAGRPPLIAQSYVGDDPATMLQLVNAAAARARNDPIRVLVLGIPINARLLTVVRGLAGGVFVVIPGKFGLL